MGAIQALKIDDSVCNRFDVVQAARTDQNPFFIQCNQAILQ